MKLQAAALRSLSLLRSFRPMPSPACMASGQWMAPAGCRQGLFVGSHRGTGRIERHCQTPPHPNLYWPGEALAPRKNTIAFPENTVRVGLAFINRPESGKRRSMPRNRPAALLLTLVTVSVTHTACRVGPPKFDDVVGEYVYVSLSFQPTLATEVGYQRHAGLAMGELLDDVSQSALGKRREFYNAFEKGFSRFDRARLAPEDQIDYDLIQARIAADRAGLEDYYHRPGRYAEILERALRVPLEKNYAPAQLRAFHVTRRLELVPPFVDHAKRNLRDAAGPAPDWDGLRRLIERAAAFVGPEIRSKFEPAQAAALAALKDLESFVGALPPGESLAAEPRTAVSAPPAPAGSSLARRVLRAGFRDPGPAAS